MLPAGMTFDRVARFMHIVRSTQHRSVKEFSIWKSMALTDEYRCNQPRRLIMSYTTVEEQAADRRILTEQELADTSKEVCDMFPGDWFVDPEVDYTEIGTPKIRIHPITATNSLKLSFGFGRQVDSLFYVVIQPYSCRDGHLTKGIPFGTLAAALTMCQRIVLHRLALSSDYTQDDQIASHQPRIWNSSAMKLP
jgi:hypothetical protein